MRLGFAVKVLGAGGLQSHDARRWQSGPDLSVSLDHLDAILTYLDASDIRLYRMATSLAPYASHPELTRFRDQPARCAEQLAAIGRRAHELRIRLTCHPGQYTVLNSKDPAVRRLAAVELEVQAEIMDGMGLGEESVVVLHVGGATGGIAAGIERFERGFEALSDAARARVVVENDDRSYGLGDVLPLSERIARPVVWDALHHHCHDPHAIPAREALERALATWPAGITPKIHYSTPKTAVEERKRRIGRRVERTLVLPQLRAHADMIDPIAFEQFLAQVARGLEFDVMLEAKAKDLALLRLREQLRARAVVARERLARARRAKKFQSRRTGDPPRGTTRWAVIVPGVPASRVDSVLITGCSSGIGRATAARLAARGMTVFATARRIDHIADLEARGCRLLALDVTDERSMREAVAAVEQAAGAVGTLVNNAGYSQSGAIENVDMDDVRRQFETNVFGLARLCQLVLPGMRRERGGRIVNVSSMGGRFTFPGGGYYHATKHAVEAISDALRFEVRGFGVDVIIVEPGLIRTRFGATAAGSVGTTAAAEGPYGNFENEVARASREVYEKGPLARLGGPPEAVAEAIEKALAAERPRPRYKVTASARALIAARAVLGDRGWDRMLRRRYPQPGMGPGR